MNSMNDIHIKIFVNVPTGILDLRKQKIYWPAEQLLASPTEVNWLIYM